MGIGGIGGIGSLVGDLGIWCGYAIRVLESDEKSGVGAHEN